MMAPAYFANVSANNKLVLFLSNDNYCCGRFCEELFNHAAATDGLEWTSMSRALSGASSGTWTYPMSPIAIDFLRRRGVAAARRLEPPVAVCDVEIRKNDLAIALDESSNRAGIAEHWSQLSNRVRYWRGGVLDARMPNDVFELLSENVYALVQELSSDHSLRAA